MPEDKSIALITSRLKKLEGYILSRKLLFGVLTIVAAIMAALVLANISYWLFYLPIWFRTAFVIVSLASALVLSILLVVKPLIKRPSSEDLALLVEKKNPQLKTRLIASLQLEKKLLSNKENYSPALIYQCIKQADSLTGNINLQESYKSSEVRNGLRYFGLTALLTAAIWLLSPGLFSSSLEVFSHPLKKIPREMTYNLAVSPESSNVLKYDDLKIKAVVFGSKLPGKARIYWKVADAWRSDNIDIADTKDDLPEEFADSLINAVDTSLFTYKFKEIRHDFKYYVESGERTSPVYEVRVVDKPRINNIKLTYFYPKYTGLAPVVLNENDGTIQALKGTRVKIEAELNKPVESGKIVFDDGSSRDVKINDSLLETSVKVTGEGSYHLDVVDNIGHTNPDPIEYRIYVLEDSYPQIQIVKPGGNIDLDDYMAFDLTASLSDDFGFSRLVMHYMVYLSQTDVKVDSIEFKFDRKKTDQLIQFYWDLSNLGLYPGSYVDYYMEVYDNDVISGPKSTVSRTYTARQPTIDEMFVEIEDARKDMISEMVETMQKELKLQESAKDLREDLQFQDEIKWETQKDINKTSQDQSELMEKLNQMAQEFQETNETAKKNDMLSLEMIQKLNELQKLFDKVATPEMKEAMKKLQEALEQMDKTEIEKAMKDFEMSTEDVIKNLERAIAQLKKFQIEQKMQAMIAMVEKILENQNNVNKETSDANKDELPGLKNKEDRNKEDVNNLKKHADELRDLLKENQLSDDQNASQFCQSVEKTDVDMDMQKMSENLQKKNQQSAMQSGQTSSAKLEDLLSRMKESQANFNNQMSAETAEKMRRAIDDILYLSEQQEGLYDEILPLSSRSQVLPEYAEKQQNLKSEADRLRTELQEIAKQSAFIQAALDRFMKNVSEAMDASISALTNLNGRSSTSYQSESIYNLNQSAQTLIKSLNSESQCNSSCSNNHSMFKKMKKLCKGQNKVNRKTQNSCQNPSDNPGKPGKESLRRLAVQQSQIRNGIAKMQEEFGDRKDVAGRLDKLAEQMKKVIEALESGDVKPGTLERQKNIYNRMLDFQLSLERRDYSEQRRADQGNDVIRKSPEELGLQKNALESANRAKLEKFMDESYPPEYESLIRDYYKALMQNQK